MQRRFAAKVLKTPADLPYLWQLVLVLLGLVPGSKMAEAEAEEGLGLDLSVAVSVVRRCWSREQSLQRA